MRDSGHARGVRDTEFGRVSRPHNKMSFTEGQDSRKILDSPLRGLRAPANPAGPFGAHGLPDFLPEQVCQDRGICDSLQSPAVQRIRTGGPDLTIRVADLSRFWSKLSAKPRDTESSV